MTVFENFNGRKSITSQLAAAENVKYLIVRASRAPMSPHEDA